MKNTVDSNDLFPLQNTKVFAFCKNLGGTADLIRPLLCARDFFIYKAILNIILKGLIV